MTNDTKLQIIDIVPGFDRNNTSYGSEGRWIDGDKIRFVDGKPRKIGGWVKQSTNQFKGVARDILSWSALDSTQYLAFGTEKKLYLYEGGSYFDITPVRATATPISAFSTSAGSTQIRVRVSSHGVSNGDFVVVSAAATVGGNVLLNREYEVVSVVDPNVFVVSSSTTAVNTTTNSGSGTVSFLLANGPEFNFPSFGWGSGTWSAGTWGTPRSGSGLTNQLRQWSLDNWGEDLVACPRGGKIYTWDETLGSGTRAFEVTGAPTQNNFILVSYPTRHLVALGSTDVSSGVFDPMLVRWCSSENLNDWGVSAGNTAGFFRLDHGSYLVGGEPSKRDILVFSDEAAYSMQYLGGEFVFGFNLLAQEAGLVSQHASANIDGTVVWMSQDSFYEYDGVLRTIECPISDAVFGDGLSSIDDPETEGVEPFEINRDQKEMVYAGINAQFNEIIWFYPAGTSTKCNRYVIYNFKDKAWSDGTLERSTWLGKNIFNKPIATSNDGYLFVHESGVNDDSNPMRAYIKSGYFDLDEGDQLMFADRFIPDFKQQGQLTLELKAKKYPQSSESYTRTYVIPSTGDVVSVRLRGRQAALKIISDEINGDFVMGRPRIALKPDGDA
jgi:hypothetical protein